MTALDCAGETVTVTNGGQTQANLTGWTLHDDGKKHTFIFSTGFVLAPNTAVTIRSDNPAQPGELDWLDAPVWNNDGDSAHLVDAAGVERSARGC